MSRALFMDDEQIKLLREVLDFVPLTPRYMPFVVDLLQRLPEPSSALPPAGGTAPSAHGEGRRFQLIPLTPRGAQGAAVVEAMLRRVLPHGDGDL